MNKRDLSEHDTCSQLIGPAIEQGGWDRTTQVREDCPSPKAADLSFTTGNRTSAQMETNLSLTSFLLLKCCGKNTVRGGLAPEEEQIVLQDYFEDGSGKEPRYYQCISQ